MDGSFLSILPEWGVLGAFIAITLSLVGLFMGYMRERDELIADIHRECEEKIERITDNCIKAMHENTIAIKDLESQMKVLNGRLSR